MPLDGMIKRLIKSVLSSTFKLKMEDVEEIKDPFVKKLSDAMDAEISRAIDAQINNGEENTEEALIITKDILIRILENNPAFKDHFINIVREVSSKIWMN